MYRLSDLNMVDFPFFDVENSFLVVYESLKKMPFSMNRVFVVKTMEKITRGSHAHKECSQILVVLNGECKITCDDGSEKKEIMLNDASKGLLIPPTIWATQEYQTNTILMVLTDKPYDENDYIRNYEAFIKFREII